MLYNDTRSKNPNIESISFGSVSYTSTDDLKILTKVVAVKLRGPAGVVQKYVLLDDGYELTSIEDNIAKQL